MHVKGFWSAPVSRAHSFWYSGADKKPLTRKDDSMSFEIRISTKVSEFLNVVKYPFSENQTLKAAKMVPLPFEI